MLLRLLLRLLLLFCGCIISTFFASTLVKKKKSKFNLQRLPREIISEILSFLDPVSVCHLHDVYRFSGTVRDAARYHLTRCGVVEATSEEVIGGDVNKVGISTLTKLPPLHVHVTTPAGLLKQTKQFANNVEYKSLSLTITKGYNNPDIVARANLQGLPNDIRALTMTGISDINPEDIPQSVAELSFINCTFVTPPNFAHLTHLTHFKSEKCNIDGLMLPQSITTIDVDVSVLADLSRHVNLRHVSGTFFFRISWRQIVTAKVFRFGEHHNFDQLRELTFTNASHDLRGFHLPSLKRVWFQPRYGSRGDVTEFFTVEQLARLESLKGPELWVSDMSLLPQAEVLHITVNEVITEHFLLPPKLIEFMVYSDEGVQGIPQQLEVFGYTQVNVGLSDRQCTVNSSNLKRLLVSHIFGPVTVVCLNLISLVVKWATIEKLEVPSLIELSFRHTGGTIPLNAMPQLRHLYVHDEARDVVLEHPLKSVILHNTMSHVVTIEADEVTLRGRVELPPTPSIITKVLNVECNLENTNGIVCQELNCVGDGRVGYVPSMVEKVSVDKLSISQEYLFFKRDTTYHKLRSLTIGSASFTNGHKLNVPASMKQLRLGDVAFQSERDLRVNDATEIEHVECMNRATAEQIDFQSMSQMTVYVPPPEQANPRR